MTVTEEPSSKTQLQHKHGASKMHIAQKVFKCSEWCHSCVAFWQCGSSPAVYWAPPVMHPAWTLSLRPPANDPASVRANFSSDSLWLWALWSIMWYCWATVACVFAECINKKIGIRKNTGCVYCVYHGLSMDGSILSRRSLWLGFNCAYVIC